ncbi:MAG: LysM peptidoglycan-binding domain-containing protein [Ferruginibacter sp.]
MPAGQLEKMKIFAYSDPGLSNQVGETFVATINPETYSTEYKIEYNDAQAQGQSASQARFTRTPPEEMSFEFLFDNTGIIDGRKRDDLTDEINEFRELLVGYDGDTHEPKHFKLGWGTLLFKGRCTALNINYKLFNANGAPIRAICNVSFKGSLEEDLRIAMENNKSPDLTHYRLVKKGDTLPLMCFKIYGDSKYYLQVAKVNQLNNFRNLSAGDEIFFPPIAKTSTK